MNLRLKTPKLKILALGLAALPLAALAYTSGGTTQAASVTAPPAPTLAAPLGNIVGLRRLTESQYRNSIADIFGPDVVVSGRFEPIVRPGHGLISAGARDSSVTPSGLEQYDAIARNIAGQVFGEARRQQFIRCTPADAAKADAGCASAVLTPLGRYLFRRPLTTEEQAFYVKLASDTVPNTGSFYKGLELGLAAMLTSPKFLYVMETAEADPARPGELRLDNYSRASRLSMLLWDSAPNEALLSAAAQGKLTDQAQLQTMAASMVKSSRFEQGVRAFFSDMLLFEKFGELSKDSIVYPYFNTDVFNTLPEQMLRTITDHLVTRGGDYRQLFTTNRTFMTRALGPVYQVAVPQSHGWVPYEFAPGDDRAGLLGQAGFLALYSHSGRSSPTLRGRAIRELLMCQPVPDPPGNVNFTAVQETNNKAMPTARIRLGEHNLNPVCAGCHKITDPIGLSLERFDGIGATRRFENGAEIDISGALGAAKFQGAAGLGQALAADPQTTQCVTTRAIEYATGRTSAADSLVEAVEQGFAADKYSIRALFLRVATVPEAYQVNNKPLDNAHQQVTMASIRQGRP
jgi:hypothetical protein